MRAGSVILVASVSFCVGAPAQVARSAIKGAMDAISDQAQRDIDMQRELELARKRAEIEVEMQRRIQEARVGTAPPSNLLAEQARMQDKNPQWQKILASNAYRTWMGTRPMTYQEVCRTAQIAPVLTSCIDDFFNAAILQVK